MMETTRVITTYKNGKLVGHKKLTDLERKPLYSDGLAATEALQHSLHKTQKAFEEMSAELYSLRRQLIEAKREVKARTKERNGLRHAYREQGKEVKKLEKQNEDLHAKLFSAAEDLKHLEQAAAQHAKNKAQQEKPKQDNLKSRSIAASPVKG